MRSRSPRPTRILIALTACGSLALAACGSDGGGDDSDGGDSGGGDNAEAFCAALFESTESDLDTTDEEDLEMLRSIAASAPSEVSDAMDTMVDAFEQLLDLDFENATEEQLAEFEALLPSFEEATAEVESYARDNCPDLPDDFFSTE
jgi:hypothetical protein